jgi:hypothetical protein
MSIFFKNSNDLAISRRVEDPPIQVGVRYDQELELEFSKIRGIDSDMVS